MKLITAVLLSLCCLPAFAQLGATATPFTPTAGAHCKDETTSSTAASVALPTGQGVQYQVYMAPSVATYVQFSQYGSTAQTGKGMQLPAGVVVVLSAPVGYASLDYVSASSGTMNICVGQGN